VFFARCRAAQPCARIAAATLLIVTRSADVAHRRSSTLRTSTIMRWVQDSGGRFMLTREEQQATGGCARRRRRKR
jgi:hypothetical protein